MNDKRKISPDFDIALFQDRLKKAMKDKGFTNASFAEAIGISEPALISYKRNNEPSIPSIDKVVTMAKHLDVSIDYLCGREEAKQVDFSDVLEELEKDELKEIFKAIRTLIDNLNVRAEEEETSYDGIGVYSTNLSFINDEGILYDYCTKYMALKALINEHKSILGEHESALLNDMETKEFEDVKINILTKSLFHDTPF